MAGRDYIFLSIFGTIGAGLGVLAGMKVNDYRASFRVESTPDKVDDPVEPPVEPEPAKKKGGRKKNPKVVTPPSPTKEETPAPDDDAIHNDELQRHFLDLMKIIPDAENRTKCRRFMVPRLNRMLALLHEDDPKVLSDYATLQRELAAIPSERLPGVVDDTHQGTIKAWLQTYDKMIGVHFQNIVSRLNRLLAA
jgi:hypothetical protein